MQRTRIIAALVALVAAGCIPAPGTDNAFYVTLPYAGALVATALCLATQLRLARRPRAAALTDEDRDRRLRLRLPVALTLCLMAAIGELAFLILQGPSARYGYVAPGTTASSSHPLLFAAAFVGLTLGSAALLASLSRQALDR